MADKPKDAELRMLGSMILAAKHAADAAAAAFAQYLGTIQPEAQAATSKRDLPVFMRNLAQTGDKDADTTSE